MIADDRVVENIKKLQKLGMSHDEIIENLIRMGLTKDESIELIKKSEQEIKAKEDEKKQEQEKRQDNIIKNEKPEEKEIPDDFFGNDDNTAMNQKLEEPETDLFPEDMDVSRGLEMNKLDDMKTDEPINTPVNVSNIGVDNSEYKPDIDFKGAIAEDVNIWQKGIITTINMKLTELENKQKMLEENLKSKIDESKNKLNIVVNEELNKLNNVQASSRQLLLAKITNDINNEMEKTNVKVATELAKVKMTEAKIGNDLAKLEEDKATIIRLSTNLEARSNELKEIVELTKKQNDLLAQKADENISKIITNLTTKLNIKIKEINDTLALQSRITEGLVKNTQGSIEAQIKRLNEFTEGIKKTINPKQIYDKLAELDTFKTQLANRYDERFEKVKIEFLAKAKEAMKNEIATELREIKNVRDTVVQKTDPEIINKKLDELKLFEENLLASVDEKITQSLKIYESSLTQEFKDKIKEIDKTEKALEKDFNKIGAIQEKMDELTKFKEQFIAVIDKNIEVMNQNMQALNERVKQINSK